MPHHPGEEVTVVLAPGDPYILRFQRYGFVTRLDHRGRCYIRLGAVVPVDEEFGPFPPERLQHGWHDENGRWR
jgi:hypothetical protein